jgi:hypothetical protein
MPPVPGRVVVGGKQSLLLEDDLLYRLGPLYPELVGERLDG